MRFIGAPIERRCTVVRSKEDGFVDFSPVRIDRKTIDDLNRIGEVEAFVVASRFHDSFFEDYFAQFPQARFLAPKPVLLDHPDWPLAELTDSCLELEGLEYLELRGMPRIREHVFYHKASRALIVADAVMAIHDNHSFFDKIILKFAGIGETHCACKLFRSLIRDKDAFRESIREVLRWDIQAILPGHGDYVLSRGKEVFANAHTEDNA